MPRLGLVDVMDADLVEVPRHVQRDIKFVLAKTMSEVLPIALAAEKVAPKLKDGLRRGRAVRHRNAGLPAIEPPISPPQPH